MHMSSIWWISLVTYSYSVGIHVNSKINCFGQTFAHPVLDYRWRVCVQQLRSIACLLRVNRRVYTVSYMQWLYANIIYAVWWFWLLGLNELVIFKRDVIIYTRRCLVTHFQCCITIGVDHPNTFKSIFYILLTISNINMYYIYFYH